MMVVPEPGSAKEAPSVHECPLEDTLKYSPLQTAGITANGAARLKIRVLRLLLSDKTQIEDH